MNNWFTSTLETVREKSLGALEFVRKDLNEFTTVVKSDTETYLHKIKSQPVGNLGINRFVRRLSNTVTSNNDQGKHLVLTSSLDRLHNERLRLQNDESTYLLDPTPTESYEDWIKTNDFNVDKHKGEIAQILIDSPHIRAIYSHLVPSCTTHTNFWSRYFFRLHQLDQEEIKRTNLIKRAHEICNENHHDNDWDEPDEEWPNETSNKDQKTETVVCERKESDTGDSWEKEFDETDLNTSKNPTIPIESTSLPVINTIKSDNEFDDEWESWS